MENPIKIDDLGVPLFLETPIYIYNIINTYSSILIQRSSKSVGEQQDPAILHLDHSPFVWP